MLGVIFDFKLNWSEHVLMALLKTNKALNAIRLIKIFFTCKELLQIVTSDVFSFMYYKAEIWLIPTLCLNSKKKLLSASAAPLPLKHAFTTTIGQCHLKDNTVLQIEVVPTRLYNIISHSCYTILKVVKCGPI